MAGTWAPPASDGSGRDRAFLKKGFDALKKAGYELKDGTMIGPDGKPLTFEILLNGKARRGRSPAPGSVRWRSSASPSRIRSVDSAQYLQRQRVYDFDAMLMTYTSSLSPGTEQQFRWGSASRDADGTFNFAGVADPAIDAMIDHLLTARSQEEFVTAVRAYDRLLLSGAYVVPLYFQPDQWVARWAGIKHPETTPIYGYQLPTWWRRRARRYGREQDGSDGRTTRAKRSPSTSISDVVCPWCFLGQKRLDIAIAEVGDVDVEVHWRPFQLDPTIPPEGKDRKRYMIDKFGSEERIRQAHERLEALGEAVGIDFAFDAIKIVAQHARRAPRHPLGGNRRRGRAEPPDAAAVQALFRARRQYRRPCRADRGRARKRHGCRARRDLAATDADVDAVRGEIATAQRMGVTGVPCFLIEGKYAVMGAQESADASPTPSARSPRPRRAASWSEA